MALWSELNQLEETLDQKEYEKEKLKRTIGLFLGPILFVLLEFFIAPPAELSPIAWRCLALILWIVVWWVLEPFAMPTTSLLGLFMFPILGILPAGQVLANLGHPASFMIIGAFILVESLGVSGFGKRISLWAVTRPWVNSTWRLAVALSCVSFALSAIMPNIPVAILLVGITFNILKSIDAPLRSNTTTLLLFSATFPAVISGIVTPIGCTAANFLFIGVCQTILGESPSFGHWVITLLPIALILFAVMFLLFKIFLKEDGQDSAGGIAAGQEDILKAYNKLGKMTRKEWYSITFVFTAVMLWLLPGVAMLVWGPQHPTTQLLNFYLSMSNVAVFIALALLIVPLNWKKREYTLSWQEAAKAVDIGLLIFVAIVFTLPAAIQETGLLDFITGKLGAMLGNTPIILVIFILNIMVSILTQLGLQMPAIALVVPITAGLMGTLGGNPLAAALVVSMVSVGGTYMIPISTPVHVIPFASGRIPMGEYLKIGGIFSVVWIVVLTFIAYPWAAMIL